MINSEKFKDVFGLYATELWAMPEEDFLNWINTEYKESESAQPEIIRCKECVYSHMTYGGECKYCDMWGQVYESGESLYLEGDFFCAFGKKKETNGSDGDK